MQRSKCQNCGLVSVERDLCPRCKSPLFAVRAAPAAAEPVRTDAKSSFSPLRILLAALVLSSFAYFGYDHLRPETEADRDRALIESDALDTLIGGSPGESREDKLKALKKSNAKMFALGEQERQAREDQRAGSEAQNYQMLHQPVPGPPQKMMPMPGNPQAMVPAPR